MVSIRVLLVDDQEMMRMAYRMVIESQEDLAVVGEADSGRAAVSAVAETRPDVVLMDVRMPVMDGVEATRRIVASDSPAHVLVLTTFDLDEYVFAALKAGASGFLLKDTPPADLLSAIRAVAAGDAVVSPRVTRRLLAQFAGLMNGEAKPSDEQRRRLDSLTAREHEVLLLITRGLSNGEIAVELVLSETTVKSHVGRILSKLDCRDRVQAVVFAYESGLVSRSGASR